MQCDAVWCSVLWYVAVYCSVSSWVVWHCHEGEASLRSGAPFILRPRNSGIYATYWNKSAIVITCMFGMGPTILDFKRTLKSSLIYSISRCGDSNMWRWSPAQGACHHSSLQHLSIVVLPVGRFVLARQWMRPGWGVVCLYCFNFMLIVLRFDALKRTQRMQSQN